MTNYLSESPRIYLSHFYSHPSFCGKFSRNGDNSAIVEASEKKKRKAGFLFFSLKCLTTKEAICTLLNGCLGTLMNCRTCLITLDSPMIEFLNPFVEEKALNSRARC
jgi:hypothetical protein